MILDLSTRGELEHFSHQAQILLLQANLVLSSAGL